MTYIPVPKELLFMLKNKASSICLRLILQQFIQDTLMDGLKKTCISKINIERICNVSWEKITQVIQNLRRKQCLSIAHFGKNYSFTLSLNYCPKKQPDEFCFIPKKYLSKLLLIDLHKTQAFQLGCCIALLTYGFNTNKIRCNSNCEKALAKGLRFDQLLSQLALKDLRRKGMVKKTRKENLWFIQVTEPPKEMMIGYSNFHFIKKKKS